MAHWCGSAHIARASRVSGLIYVASMMMWLNAPSGGEWRNAVLDLFALAYFYQKWSAREPQHRQFHFVMMLSYLTSTAFYAFQAMVQVLPGMGGAIGMSPWWHHLISNILFELELMFIIVYALLYRRAHADKRKFRTDTERWLARVKPKQDLTH